MVESQRMLLCSVIAVFCCIQSVVSIECYECSTGKDTKCANTFNYQGTAKDALKVKCTGATAACRKVISRDAHKENEMVIRSCWNSTSVEELDEDFLSCNKIMDTSTVCYCQTDLCNTAPTVLAPGLVTMLLVSLWTVIA